MKITLDRLTHPFDRAALFEEADVMRFLPHASLRRSLAGR